MTFHTLFFKLMTYLYLFSPSEKVRDSNISGCQSTEQPNIVQGSRKVLFVCRKPCEQTGWWNNGACWATTNHRGWVLCFRESAENTKLLKCCAHLSNTDDTGLLIQNAAQPPTVNSQPEIGLAIALWKKSFDRLFSILKMKNCFFLIMFQLMCFW